MGSIFVSEGVATLCGCLILPALLERFSGHAILSVLCLIICAGLLAVPLSTSIAHVCCAYFLVGGCLGMLSIVANTLTAWVQAGHNVGPSVNLVNSGFGLGASAAPLLFVGCERHLGSGLRGFAAIGLVAAGAALSGTLLRSPARPANDDSGAGLRSPVQSAEDSSKFGPVARGGSTVCGVDVGSRATYVRLTVLAPLMASMSLGIGGEIAFGAWIFSFATKRVGMAPPEAAALNACFWSTFTLGRMAIIPLAVIAPPEMLLLPTMALEVVSCVLVLCFPTSASVLWVSTVGCGIGVCGLGPNAISLLASYELLSPQVVSAIQFAFGTGHMVVPNLVAVVMRHTDLGLDALFYVLCVGYLASLLLVGGVAAHLGRHFTPAKGSLHEARQLAARRRRVHAAASEEEGKTV